MSTGWDRRDILKLIAGAAAGGLAGCERRIDMLTADVTTPPGMVAGIPDFYSSASVLDGYAAGILVRHDEGRPIKVEGNPAHPASLGATDIFAQSLLLSFYDPARARAPTRNGQPASWASFVAEAERHRGRLRILSGSVTAPALAAQIGELRGARWHRWNAVSRDAVRDGALLAFNRPVDMIPDLTAADIVLAIDSDLLSSAPGHLRHARDFAARRNPVRGRMSRIYAVESTPTLTGAAADRRFVAGPGEIHDVLLGLAATLLRNEPLPERSPPWLAAVIADLKRHHRHSLVHLGPDHPAEAHALIHAVNEALGGRGSCFTILPAAEAKPVRQRDSLAELAEDMRAGAVDTLLILDGNPVLTAPADLGFAEALRRVPFSVSLTANSGALWSIPAAHPFEAWSDARAYDGSITLIQPQARPLHGGRSAAELVALLAGDRQPDGRALLARFWRERLSDAEWHGALAAGVVAGSASRPLDIAPHSTASLLLPEQPVGNLTVLFRPEPHLWDGSFAGNGWLQELPRPFTKLTWDNPLLISPSLAKRRSLKNGDLVRLTAGDSAIQAPIWIQPGQAEDCVTAQFGGSFDYFPLRRGDQLALTAASLRPDGGSYPLAATEHHTPLAGEGRELARGATLAAFTANAEVVRGDNPSHSLYDPPPQAGTAWGMSIDLNACIGCNACVIACQAENNIPVVGKEQVLRQREMHWLRIDRYYQDGEIDWQPVLCMHCEEAPCEVVCPVGATLHDEEGLNVMVYNRCVGTRFCSNNCPYKVRRFNYLSFSAEEARPAQSRNPEVTVRARGVMEKCTFCLQRVAAARIKADQENRPVRDGEVVTACQAACPTQAFTFGDIRDPASKVSERKSSPLSYPLLGELNTRPRVTYEGRIRNPGDES